MSTLRAIGSCSFCGADRRTTRALVGSSITDVTICDECLALCCRVLAEAAQLREYEPGESVLDYPDESLAAILAAVAAKGPPETVLAPDLACSFCAKRRRDVPKMVIGPRVGICDACVGVAVSTAKRADNA